MWDLKLLRTSFEACIAVSEFNKKDLRKAGYTCPIAVLPVLVPFKDYNEKYEKNHFRYSKGFTKEFINNMYSKVVDEEYR